MGQGAAVINPGPQLVASLRDFRQALQDDDTSHLRQRQVALREVLAQADPDAEELDDEDDDGFDEDGEDDADFGVDDDDDDDFDDDPDVPEDDEEDEI